MTDGSLMSPWIETVSGKKFEFLAPTDDMFDIEDIAHALGMTCRYSGHTPYFYSVAEHSVLVSYLVPHHLAFPALMHDASEAYITDIASPVKAYLTNYKELENTIMLAVAKKWNFDYPLEKDIKQADLQMLSTEAYYILPSRGHSWDMWNEIEGGRPIVKAGFRPTCAPPERAKKLFLDRFKELYDKAADY